MYNYMTDRGQKRGSAAGEVIGPIAQLVGAVDS
jgi:hypothetical protein